MPVLRNIAGAVIGEIIGHKKGHGLIGAGIGVIATRVATRSIPGAVLVGGILAAKYLYDKKREQGDI